MHDFLFNKSKSAKLYIRENGLLWLVIHTLTISGRRIRDFIYGSQIGCPTPKLGKYPKLMGIRHIQVGKEFRAGDFLWLEAVTRYQGITYNPRIIIGDKVGVSDHVHIGSTSCVTIGDGVLIGSRVIIIDHNHGTYSGEAQSDPDILPSQRILGCDKSIFIGSNVWIGDGVVVLPGSTIGNGSVIGANSVVSGSIPPNCIAIGSPVRPIRHYDRQSGKWIKREDSE